MKPKSNVKKKVKIVLAILSVFVLILTLSIGTAHTKIWFRPIVIIAWFGFLKFYKIDILKVNL